MSDNERTISEAVGIVGSMPGNQGFTMACFKADEVPVGTPLYLHPQLAEMERQQGDVLENLANKVASYVDFSATLAATGKQQVGEVQGDARARFEAWAKREFYDITRYEEAPDRYLDKHTRNAWNAWQAALSARQQGAQLPVASIDPRHLFLMAGKDGTLSGNVLRFGASMQPGDAPLYAALPAQADHPYQRITGLQGIGDAADYLARHPGDDYAQRRLSERVTEFCKKHGVSPAQGIDLGQVAQEASDPSTQIHIGTNAATGGQLWHSDGKGGLWCGNTYHRTPQQLWDECQSVLSDLRNLAEDQHDAAPGVEE